MILFACVQPKDTLVVIFASRQKSCDTQIVVASVPPLKPMANTRVTSVEPKLGQ